MTVDVFKLTDKGLREHIETLQFNKANMLSNVTPSTKQLDEQIQLAQHELAARASSRLARISIIISTVAVTVAAVSVILQITVS